MTGQHSVSLIWCNGATFPLQPPAVEHGSTEATSRKPHPKTDPLRRHTWSLWSTGSDRRWIKDASLKTLECESINAPRELLHFIIHTNICKANVDEFTPLWTLMEVLFIFICMPFSVQQYCTGFCRSSVHHATQIAFPGFGYLFEDSNPSDTSLLLFCSTGRCLCLKSWWPWSLSRSSLFLPFFA